MDHRLHSDALECLCATRVADFSWPDGRGGKEGASSFTFRQLFFFKSMLILPPWSKALWTLLSVLVSTLSSPLRAVLPEIFWGSRKLTIHLLYLLPRGTRSLSRKEERETLFPYLPVGWRGGSVCLGVGSG